MAIKGITIRARASLASMFATPRTESKGQRSSHRKNYSSVR